MLTKANGDLAVAYAIHYYTVNDYEVCLPIGDKRPYDLIIEKIVNSNEYKSNTPGIIKV